MIKVMWFLKRAEHLSPEAFADWWLNSHALDVAHHQAPHLKKYVVNISSDDRQFAGGPGDEMDWDGIAEQWFDHVESYNAVYGRAESPTRGDTLAHTSRFARLIVTENEIATK